MKTLLTGLFRAAKRTVGQVKDAIGAQFREAINGLVAQKDTLTDEQIGAKVEELKGMAQDLPETEDKAKLIRFLDDFKAVKEQEANVAQEAAKSVADLFERLDADAMKDAPQASPAETPEPAGGKQVTAEPDIKDEGGDAKSQGNDMNAKDEAIPTLEEIYEYVKKRMAEETSQAQDSDEEPKKDDGVQTQDHAVPNVAVQLTEPKAAAGGLDDLFASAKKGGR